MQTLSIQVKPGTKDTTGRILQIGDTVDCYGHFKDGKFIATRIALVEEDRRDAN
jgi:hypothetical protein